MPQALFLAVCLNQGDLLFATAGELEVVKRHVVNREDRCGGTEFGAHVTDGGTVSQRNSGHTFTVELYELSNHTVLTEHVGNSQNDVGCSHTGRNLTGELETYNTWDQHGNWLTQHCCFGFNTTYTPTEDTQTVHHGGVGVGTNEGVRVCTLHTVNLAGHDNASQVLDVDLVDDTHARRYDLEVVECGLTPAQELVAFAVALVFDVHVAFDCLLGSERVNLN